MFLGMFRGDFQKIVKNGSKFGPPGPKKRPFFALFWPFSQFFGLRNCSSEWFFLFFNMMFLGIIKSDLQKIVKKEAKFGPPGAKKWPFFALFWPFSQFFGLNFFFVNEFFWFFNMMFLGIFRSDLQRIVKKRSKFGPPGV